MPSPPARVLVIDDEPDLRTLYELTLVREGYEVECAATVQEAWQLLQSQVFSAVVTDMRLPDGTGLDLLRRLEADRRAERAVVITAFGSAENAVESLKAGAFDYLTKPVDLRQFRSVVASACGREAGPVRRNGASASAAAARAAQGALRRMAGDSAAMRQVRVLVDKVSRSMAPVLVCGESGTGKELVARAIHEASPRNALPFVAVNCAAIPETLLEAEFFGYRKGAFTGASDDRDGFFQAAFGGTLFLDEVGELPLTMQTKLLRAVQERAVRPVGSTAEQPVNVRLISATHRDLEADVAGGRFRQDLYYRLNVIRIEVPPLRDRLQDLPQICSAVLERIAAEAGVQPVPVMSPQALERLERFRFAGNVRELENLLHRALALSGAEVISAEDLGLPPSDFGDSAPVPLGEFRPPLARAGSNAAPAAPQRKDGDLPSDLAAYLDGIERAVLEEALLRHRYNRTAAGASLGLSLRQIRYRMARLGISGPASAPGEPA